MGGLGRQKGGTLDGSTAIHLCCGKGPVHAATTHNMMVEHDFVRKTVVCTQQLTSSKKVIKPLEGKSFPRVPLLHTPASLLFTSRDASFTFLVSHSPPSRTHFCFLASRSSDQSRRLPPKADQISTLGSRLGQRSPGFVRLDSEYDYIFMVLFL